MFSWGYGQKILHRLASYYTTFKGTSWIKGKDIWTPSLQYLQYVVFDNTEGFILL